MFQSLRQQNIFYILQKGDNPSLKVGQVVSVSNPQPKYGQLVPGQAFGQNVETVVDVSVKVGEIRRELFPVNKMFLCTCCNHDKDIEREICRCKT